MSDKIESHPRQCIVCGKIHDIVLQDLLTGEVLEEFDKCKHCLVDILNKCFDIKRTYSKSIRD